MNVPIAEFVKTERKNNMKYVEDAFVNCPFYHKENANSIYCEGLVENSTNITYLGAGKKRHKEIYCRENYYKCPLHKTLMGKYEF